MPKRWHRLPTDTDNAPVFTVADYYRHKLTRIPPDLSQPSIMDYHSRMSQRLPREVGTTAKDDAAPAG